MIWGKAMKARPMPSSTTVSTLVPAVVAMKPRAPKTPIPASSSKELLAKAAVIAVPVRSALRRR